MEENAMTEAFTFIPDMRELKCIICESYPMDSHTSPAFHCIYMCSCKKCIKIIYKKGRLYRLGQVYKLKNPEETTFNRVLRNLEQLILNEIPEVILAPNNSSNTIYLISTKSDSIIERIKLVPYLWEKLRFLDAELITPAIYQTCLTYSILLKASPNWIRMDEYFIQSKAFLEYKKSMDAVKVNFIQHSETILRLELRAVMIDTVPYFQSKSCTPSCWKDYNENKNGYINMSLSQQVYILPRFI